MNLNFRGLKYLYAVFLFRIWLHRARLILVRLAVIIGGTWFLTKAMEPGGIHWSGNSTYEVNLTLWVGVPLVLWIGTMTLMGMFWQLFARDNQGQLLSPHDQPSSSFLKRLWGTPAPQIALDVDGRKLFFQIHLYKEGGIWVRWREYKIDLAIRYEPHPPVELPHIVADATPRDQLKLSNLRARLKDYTDFRAEGEAGSHYRLFANSANTVHALSILTPDVLQELLASLHGADIELDGNSVWFVYRHMVLREDNLRAFVAGVEQSMGEMDKQLKPYRVKPAA